VVGRTAEALKVLDKLNERSKREHFGAYFIATIYVGLGEKDKAFEWMEKSYEEREAVLFSLRWTLSSIRSARTRALPTFCAA
jgi:hypothetical protein